MLPLCIGTSSEAFGQRNAVSGSEVTGTFRSYYIGNVKNGKGLYNEILIQALGSNKLKIEMELVYVGVASIHEGSASGEAVIEGDTAVFVPDYAAKNSESCKITLNFSKPGTLIVVTTIGLNGIDCGFGFNVSADGVYKKLSGAKPKFGAN